jgi:hypothetical protein
MSKAPDYELSTITRIVHQLAALQPSARRRVLAYVCARVETLPVIAAVGGGTEGDTPEHDTVDMFVKVAE